MDSLQTTNILLGVLTALGLIEALAFAILLAAGVLVLRRLTDTVAAVEANHVAPAAARLHAILDDVNDVTSTVKGNVRQIDRLVHWALRWIDVPSRWAGPQEGRGKEARHA